MLACRSSIAGFVTAAWIALSICAAPAQAAPAPSRAMPTPTVQPYAKQLSRLVKEWPSDLGVAFLMSGGGVPPPVQRWQVDAKGAGEFERITYPAGGQKSEKWAVHLDLADVRALLLALTEVDFEHAAKPVPDSPVQSVAITSAGHTEYINAYALLPPVATAAVQAKVFAALGKLDAQCHAQNPKPNPAPGK